MKLSTGINILSANNVAKKISKKIMLANTNDRVINEEAQKKAQSISSNPIYFQNVSQLPQFNPDIRFRYNFEYSPLTGINYRNDLLLFAENNEIKKAVKIVANEMVILESDQNRYPVSPEINMTQIETDKVEVAQNIQDYLDKIFFPMLYQWYNFKEDGLIEIAREFLTTGKICYEIIYDSLTNPNNIIGVQPIDPSTIQKVKQNGQIYYVQRPITGENAGVSAKERILHENQVILCEWNEYDFGYISYVDGLRRPFNIMRSMQTSKVLWFAAKSQVRMHIKLALGDISREEALQRLEEAKEEYITQFRFEDNGQVTFNEQPNNIGYREIFTGETAGSGQPEIEEINTQGPDLTETDSLNYWNKLFWQETEIPYDRIDPNSSETWGFADVNNLRKIEVNFGKFINSIRKMLNPLFLKPIIIQLTLKEVEIGVDLNLLDSIKMRWIAFNQYEMMAELEVLNKRVELAQNIANFGEYTDVNDKQRKPIPLRWIVHNFLDFTKEQLDSMESERIKENLMLGFNADGSVPEGAGEDGDIHYEGDELGEEEDDDFGDDLNDDFDDGMEDEDEPIEGDSNTEDEPLIVEMVKNGSIAKEDLHDMIKNHVLSDEEIEDLKRYGLYDVEEEETEEDIAAEDDANF